MREITWGKRSREGQGGTERQGAITKEHLQESKREREREK